VIALAPPSLTATVTGGTSFSLTLGGNSGQTYRVLTTTNLALPLTNWTVLTSGTFGAVPANYNVSTATNQTGFYRIVSP